MNRLFFCLIFTFFCLTFSIAQDKSSPFETKSISIFKNGSAFFIKEAKVKTTAGKFKMSEHIPTALFGTFWVHSPNGHLKSVSSYLSEENVKKQEEALTISQMLTLNANKKVQLWLKNDETYSGTILNKLKKKENGKLIWPTPIQSIVTMKTDDQWLTFPLHDIKRIAFKEAPKMHFDREEKQSKHILEVDFKNKQSEQALDLMYLSTGIAWSPIYLLELESETTAALTLRAELSNDVEDIEGTDINFVVGVPNFKFANKLSALVDFMARSGHPGFQNGSTTSNMLRSQTIGYAADSDGDSNFTPSTGIDVSANEDLYFYNLKNVHLKKGGRAHHQLFKKSINISHIYEVNIPQNQENKNFYQSDFLFSANDRNPVIHSVKLENNTSYPWTTGAIMVVNQQGETRPISQDLLTYTSNQGHTFVKLTAAPDVRLQHAEKEIKREARIKKRMHNSSYYLDLVTVQGEVKVKNYKNKDIDLNIRRTLLGNLIDSDAKWLKAERVNRSSAENKTTDVCWETNIKAGEELIIKYTYSIYVPS